MKIHTVLNEDKFNEPANNKSLVDQVDFIRRRIDQLTRLKSHLNKEGAITIRTYTTSIIKNGMVPSTGIPDYYTKFTISSSGIGPSSNTILVLKTDTKALYAFSKLQHKQQLVKEQLFVVTQRYPDLIKQLYHQQHKDQLKTTPTNQIPMRYISDPIACMRPSGTIFTNVDNPYLFGQPIYAGPIVHAIDAKLIPPGMINVYAKITTILMIHDVQLLDKIYIGMVNGQNEFVATNPSQTVVWVYTRASNSLFINSGFIPITTLTKIYSNLDTALTDPNLRKLIKP